nr:cardiolipin synthase [Corynebacterium sp. TAE3-ERU12]
MANVQWWQIAIFVADYTIKFFAIGTVPENRNPSSSTAWLLIILLLPFVGLPLFLLLGSQTITGRRHRIQAHANKEIVRRTAHLPDIPADAQIDTRGPGLSGQLIATVKLIRQLTGPPAVKGRCRAVHSDYAASIAAMTAAVEHAKHTVHVQMYIFALDPTTRPFVNALIAAKNRGVDVKVLVDPIGSRKYPGYKKLKKLLNATGVQWHAMLPISPFRLRSRRPDLRNHRKILVVDGSHAFVGSQNMIEAEYQSEANHRDGRRWHDVMVELEGDIAAHLDAVFAVDWTSEGAEAPQPSATMKIEEPIADDPDINLVQVLPSGPGYTTEPNLRVFNDLIYAARHRITVVSPYLVPDESLLMALTTAAYSGIEVRLHVNEEADQFMVGHAQQSYYQALLEAGVKIRRFPAPNVLHAKFLIIDDEIAVVGSSNLDMRSFGLNYEVTIVTACGTLVDRLVALADEYDAASSALTEKMWQDRPWRQRYLDNVFRLTSSLQ